jgi:response regulator RpfG family c-di-GMP phosphodiesterase
VSYLIIWNNTKYAEILSDFFGKEFVIKDNDELQDAIINIHRIDALIILCELDWSLNASSVNKQDLYGIDLAKELRRRHQVNIPILFTSFYDLKDIINSEREIITAIGHDFIQLPVRPEKFKEKISTEFSENDVVRKLSVMELNDIKSFYCSKEGILSHELHNLNRYLNSEINENNHDSIYAELVSTITKIHNLFLQDAGQSLNTFRKEFPALDKLNISEAVNHIIRIGNTLRNKYGWKAELIKNTEEIYFDNPWKILLLDDEIDKDNELVKCMTNNNMKVICCNNAQDAYRILYNDWSTDNTIMVVIADYRLYELKEGIKRHQKVQGYQFLKEIASSDHLVRLVAFSGLQRKFLLNSFKHYSIRTEVKSKIDYLADDHTYQLFCDEIIELAEENWEAIEALPSKCAGFEKYLKEAYHEFRMHPAYNKMENNIALTAREYVREIEVQINNKEDIRIGAIDNIKSPLAKTKKDEDAFFKRVQNYFIARRIALWLYAKNKKHPSVNVDSRKIAEILTDQKYPTDAYRQILSTNIGLSLDDFPKNITIEERKWLQYEMDMNIFRDINFIDPAFTKIASIYKSDIIKDTSIIEKIKSLEYSWSINYKQTKYNIKFETNFNPVIKTATDVRVMFLMIKEYHNKDKNQLEIIKPLASKIRAALLEPARNIVHLKNLYEYFNTINRILNREKSIIFNAATKLKDKSEFQNKSNSSINKVFDRVYELILEGNFPDENDVADVWSIFVSAENIIEKIGKLSENNKLTFYDELRKEIDTINFVKEHAFNDNIKNKKIHLHEDEEHYNLDEYDIDSVLYE